MPVFTGVREYRIDAPSGRWYHLIVGPNRRCALGSSDGLAFVDRPAATDVLRRARKRGSRGARLFAVRRLSPPSANDEDSVS